MFFPHVALSPPATFPHFYTEVLQGQLTAGIFYHLCGTHLSNVQIALILATDTFLGTS